MSTELPTGAELVGYRIEKRLGQGGMGIVYRAEHLELGRKVALKVLSPELAGSQVFRERFIRESRLAASLDHPNVIPIYEAGERDGLLYIAMRWVDGDDLGALLAREGKLEPGRAVALLSQVAGALDAAHRKGLVHRDVKPGNVLVAPGDGDDAEEHCYLCDFGLTKRLGSGRELTDAGQFVGTISYVAPEQVEGEPLDGRADVYALACVLFHCLTGSIPYPRGADVAILYAHLHESAPSASTRLPSLPAGLDEVFAKALAKEPEDRYPTCAAMIKAARTALQPQITTRVLRLDELDLRGPPPEADQPAAAEPEGAAAPAVEAPAGEAPVGAAVAAEAPAAEAPAAGTATAPPPAVPPAAGETSVDFWPTGKGGDGDGHDGTARDAKGDRDTARAGARDRDDQDDPRGAGDAGAPTQLLGAPAADADEAAGWERPRRGRGRRLAGAALITLVLVGGVGLWAFLLTGGTWPPFQGAAANSASGTTRPAQTTTTASTVPPPATRGPDMAAPGSMNGRKAATCVNGWETPDAGLAVRRDGLGIIKTRMGITGNFQVVELRYFLGADDTEWWYVKAFLAEDLDFQGRWLVERRMDGTRRIAAVAPYDTEGLRSPDWHWFDGKGSPVRYPSLPGTWAGTPYDFVAGSTGVTGGLPSDVRGCVAGT
jgi:hypothetical protein